MAKVGLIDISRESREPETLEAFTGGYLAGRNELKPSTHNQLTQAADLLATFFTPNRPLAEITPGDADDFRRWLASTPAPRTSRTRSPNTVRRLCGRAKQLFAAAAKKRLIPENPFTGMADLQVRSKPKRQRLIDDAMTAQVFEAMPDNKWRLIFALARYAGLRIPSEINDLRWEHIDWAASMMHVPTPKTEHLDGRSSKTVPIFWQLRPHLEAMRDDPLADPVFVVPHRRDHRGKISNLFTMFRRHLEHAEITPWPKLFQNLRSTRQSELAVEVGEAVACEWIGNTEKVFRAHYHQILPATVAKVTQRPGGVDDDPEDDGGGSPAVPRPRPRNPESGEKSGEKSGDADACTGQRREAGRDRPSERTPEKPGIRSDPRQPAAICRKEKTPRVGLEPTTYRLTAGRSTIELSGIDQISSPLE